jgi:hypothetical protein
MGYCSSPQDVKPRVWRAFEWTPDTTYHIQHQMNSGRDSRLETTSAYMLPDQAQHSGTMGSSRVSWIWHDAKGCVMVGGLAYLSAYLVAEKTGMAFCDPESATVANRHCESLGLLPARS